MEGFLFCLYKGPRPTFLPLPARTPRNETAVKLFFLFEIVPKIQLVSYYILLWLHCGSICQEIWNWCSWNHTWIIYLWVGSLSAV